MELIDGEIREMSPIGARHVSLVNRLTALLVRLAGNDAIVSVQNPIRLNEYNEPQPDLTLLRPREDAYLNALATPEDVLLIIEVADTSLAYDQQEKNCRATLAPGLSKSGLLMPAGRSSSSIRCRQRANTRCFKRFCRAVGSAP